MVVMFGFTGEGRRLPDGRNKRRQRLGDPGVLARGTPDQTALQDWSRGLGLALGPFRFRGLR